MNEKDARRQKILKEPLFPLLIRMAVPTIFGMLVTLLYNLTDTFWIGRLGDRSMTAAIGVVFAFVSFIQAVGFWFGYGSGNVMSRLIGAGKEQEAKIIATDGVVLSLIAGIGMLIIFSIFPEQLSVLLGGGATPELKKYTVEYLRVIVPAIPFTLYSLTVYNQMRLCGNVKDAIIGLMIGMLGNIVLDPVFIMGLHMGVAGAGIATLLGMAGSSVCLYLLSRRHGNIPAKLRLFNLKEQRLYHILAGGAPNFSRQGITGIASILLNLAAAGFGAALGETLIAALAVATRISALGYMIMIGFGQGFQPICAMNYGAKAYDRVKQALKLTVLIGTGIMLAGTVLLLLFARPLAALLSKNDDVVSMATDMIRWQCISLPFMAFYALSSMFLQNVGRYLRALFVSVCRQGIIYIPLLFVLPGILGSFGFYILQPVADLISTALGIALTAWSWKGIFKETDN